MHTQRSGKGEKITKHKSLWTRSQGNQADVSIATSSFGRQKQYPCWRQCGFTFSLLTQCGLEVTLLGIRSQVAGGRRQEGPKRGQEGPRGARRSRDEPGGAKESRGAGRSQEKPGGITPGTSWLLPASPGSARLLLATPGSSWLILALPWPLFWHFFAFFWPFFGPILESWNLEPLDILLYNSIQGSFVISTR